MKDDETKFSPFNFDDAGLSELTRSLLQTVMRFGRHRWKRGEDETRPGDMHLLMIVQRFEAQGRGPMMSELGKFLGMSTPSVTHIVTKLEAQGWVERHMDPDDRRIIRVRLGETGRERMKNKGRQMAKTFDGLVNYLGESQSRELVRLLELVRTFFENHPHEEDSKQ